MKIDIKEYPDRDLMMMTLADKLASDLNAALQTHDSVSLAVPGGTTPGPAFDTLCGVDIGWDRVSVLLTDERWVPETSDRSNARLVRQRLLTDKAAAAHFIPYFADDAPQDEVLARLSERITPLLPLSVLLLGMGSDMHTASLFPGADGLDAALDGDAPPLMAIAPAGDLEPRVSLTAPVLRKAMSIHLVITGTEKREAVKAAAKLGDPKKAPVALILDTATIHWAE